MSRPAALRLIYVTSAALLLQGCLAAAIPVVAASTMATRDVVKESREDAAKSTSEPAEVEFAVAAPTPQAEQQPAASDDSARPATVAETPPASGAATSSSDVIADALMNLAIYAGQQAVRSPDDEGGISSAMLRNPGALDGERLTCAGEASAVLIDLDPPDGLFDSATPPVASMRATNILTSLRNQNIRVGWISGRSAGDAGSVRNWLKASGFDAEAADELLLMRYPDDRKQTRRREYANEYCLLAILGDNQSDFDELYAYLNDPSLAAPLEALYGNGWFLTPTPLTQEQE